MSDALVLQSPDGRFQEWRGSSLASLKRSEQDLEAAIVARPGLLILDPLDLLFDAVAAYDQRRFRSGSGHGNIPDVILLTDQGDVVVVEVKRFGNTELRGRQVVSQVVGYAATLCSTDEAELVRTLTDDKRCDTWEALCRYRFPDVRHPARLAQRFRQRVSDGELQLVIACDRAPAELADWVRAVGNQSAIGFDLHVVEIQPMTCSEVPGTVAWLPRTRISTEIVHRTAVTVRTEGGQVHVDVTTDSAEQVDEAVQDSRSRRDRRAEALAVIAPVSDRLHLSPEEFWAQLAMIHESALEADWSFVTEALADPDDIGPYLRGQRRPGFVEGRFGVNLVRAWRPSVFVGAYLLPFDHRQPLQNAVDGGDFALIVDVQRSKRFDGDAFTRHPLFQQLRSRLSRNAGRWDFADHLARPSPNPWHPLHLRCPLRSVFEGVTSWEEGRDRWLDAARDAACVLLAGGELAELRRQFQ